MDLSESRLLEICNFRYASRISRVNEKARTINSERSASALQIQESNIVFCILLPLYFVKPVRHRQGRRTLVSSSVPDDFKLLEHNGVNAFQLIRKIGGVNLEDLVEPFKNKIKAALGEDSKLLNDFIGLSDKHKELFIADFEDVSLEVIEALETSSKSYVADWIDLANTFETYTNLRRTVYNIDTYNKVKTKFVYNDKIEFKALEDALHNHTNQQGFINNLAKADELYSNVPDLKFSVTREKPTCLILGDGNILAKVKENRLWGTSLVDAWKLTVSYPDIRKEIKILKFIANPYPPDTVLKGVPHTYPNSPDDISKINDNYQIAKANGRITEFLSRKTTNADIIVTTWKPAGVAKPKRTSIIPSFEVLIELKQEMKKENLKLVNPDDPEDIQEFSISYDELALGISGVGSPDGRHSFEITASMVKLRDSTIGTSRWAEKRLSRAFANKLKNIAQSNGISNLDNLYAVQQRLNAHESMALGAFQVGLDVKIWGFAFNLKAGTDDIIEIGFKSGSVNSYRGIGLTGVNKAPQPGQTVGSTRSQGWVEEDTILNRTDQKQLLDYILNAEFMKFFDKNKLELKKEKW